MVPYQVLPLRAIVDLGVMTIKGYSAFPKAPRLEMKMKFSVMFRTLSGSGVLPLCRDAVSAVYSLSQLGCSEKEGLILSQF